MVQAPKTVGGCNGWGMRTRAFRSTTRCICDIFRLTFSLCERDILFHIMILCLLNLPKHTPLYRTVFRGGAVWCGTHSGTVGGAFWGGMSAHFRTYFAGLSGCYFTLAVAAGRHKFIISLRTSGEFGCKPSVLSRIQCKKTQPFVKFFLYISFA